MQSGEKPRDDWGRCQWCVQGGTSDRTGIDKRGSLGANVQGNGIRSKLGGTKGEMVQGDRGQGRTEGGQSVTLQHVAAWLRNEKG